MRIVAPVLACLLAVGACAPSASDQAKPTAPPAPTPVSSPEPAAIPRPEWLGTRALPLRADGFGQALPTPPELVDRRLVSPDHLPPPPDETFRVKITAVPPDVVARSTYRDGCPTTLDELRYLRLSYWGFDGEPHTGELIVDASWADRIAGVFRELYEARFPIEEMRVVAPHEMTAPATGDGNNSSAYVCRAIATGGRWSEHAFGRAVDINPFHNPYQKGTIVLPELATSYTDRDWVRPGMITRGSLPVRLFAGIGWGWGGDWTSLKDPMHFSASGD